MCATRTIHLLLCLFGLALTNSPSYSQAKYYPYEEWTRKLRSKDGPILSGLKEVLYAVRDKDSTESIAILNELEHTGGSAGKYFDFRFNLLKAVWARNIKGGTPWSMKPWIGKALNAAYETENDSLVSGLSWWYGYMMYYAKDIELASMHCLNAAEIDERIGRKITSANYGLLGEILYATRDNEKSIYYTKKAIAAEADTSSSTKHLIRNWSNTIGLCWKRIGNYDSAFFYLNSALAMSSELNEPIWQSIVSGNKGQIYYSQKKYALAKPLLESDYRFSKDYGELASAANSLQWVARINLLEGKKDIALIQVREALQLEQKEEPDMNYLQNIYYATTDVYRAFGNYDSVYKYSQLYNRLHDSIERAVSDSRVEISRIRLDNLQNVLTIKNLNKEKRSEKVKRNFILAAILMCSVIAILVVNSRRARSVHRHQLALQQKKAAEAEVSAAKEQLDMFRQNVIEKTSLVERLQQQIQNDQVTARHSQMVAELSQQTILTEEDWDKFKSLFEKIHPGFFLKLREKASDITVAEQRMAALTRLHLTSKQMASILGISVDSVHKTRQRLRERFHLHDSSTLEELILRI